MKIKVIQDSIVFISALTVEEFMKAKKFVPESLTLNRVDEDRKKKPVCMIGYAERGGVNNNGIVFDSTTDNGYLCVTSVGAEGFDTHIPAEDKARCVSEHYSSLILKMNELETQVKAELSAKESEIAIAQESVETVAIEG